VVQFRSGSTEDTDAVLALFDANVAWLVERGRSAQWGSEPFSGNPKLVDFVRELLSRGVVTIAEDEGEVIGASVVADHPMPYVPAAGEPERYLKLLISSPARRGQKIGHRLIELARQRTISDGIGLLRVDCWAGGDRRLVSYYVSEGFAPVREFEVRPGTPVQVFEWRSSESLSAGTS
jgi:GNAT superfamily N-acetyltransferase